MNRDFASSCLNPILYIHRMGNLQITTMKTTQTWFTQYLDNPLTDGRKEEAFPRDSVVGTELNEFNWSTDLNSLKTATFTRQKKTSGSCPTGNFLKSTNSTSSHSHISQLGHSPSNHSKVLTHKNQLREWQLHFIRKYCIPKLFLKQNKVR